MHFFGNIFFGLFVFCSFYIHGQLKNDKNIYIKDINKLVNKTHAERTILLSKFYEKGLVNLDSASIYKVINSIENLATKKNDEALLLETELLKVHYYMFSENFSDDFVIKKATILNKKAKKENILWLEIRTESFLGNYLYRNVKNYGAGFEHFEKTIRLLDNVSIKEYPLKKICLLQTALIYNQFKEYKTSNKLLLKSKDLRSDYNTNHYNPHLYNTLGDNYINLKKIDSSNYYFQLNLEKATKNKDSIWMAISSGNIGTNLVLQEKYKKALTKLNFSIPIMQKAKDWSFTAGRLVDLGQVNLGLNNLREAELNSKKAFAFIKKFDAYYRYLNYYKLKNNIAIFKKQPKIAVQYLDSVFIVKDSLDKVFDNVKLIRAQQRVEVEKQKLKEEKEQQENFEKLLLRNAVIFLLLLLILFTVILFRKRYKKIKEREQKILLEKKNTEQKLAFATESLKSITNAIEIKNRKIEALERKINTNNNGTDNLELSIQQLKKSSILTEENWDEFSEFFKQVYPSFFDKIHQKFPNITASEIRLLALLKLSLKTKQMSLMLGVGDSAIRQIKSRFRRKHHIENEQELQLIIDNI